MTADSLRVPLRLEVRELSADLETPVSAYLKLRRPGVAGFLLESVAGGERLARFSFLGVGPSRAITTWNRRIRVRDRSRLRDFDGDPVELLREELAARPIEARSGLPPFRGGSVGFLSYDFVRNLERLPATAKDTLSHADAHFLRFETVVAFDHVRQTIVLMTVSDGDGLEARARLDEIEARLAEPLAAPAAPDPAQPEFHSNVSREHFRDSVRKAKEHIAAGDIFQVVLSQRWETRWEGDPLSVYRRLRRINPSPYMVFLESEAITLAAASPEMLVRVTGDRAETHPIAGTRPRSGDEEEDARREAELLADPKEISEHVMLVDLGRNDLGRVCRPGSVAVPVFKSIERYSHVCHIVSRVTGEVSDGVSPFDVLLSAFPAGTVSGAPKVRAMELIEELEGERRGSYAGAVAYVDAGGNLDSCITIRSIAFSGGKAFVQAGAGIVADSDPDLEYDETVAKSEALRAALRGGSPGGRAA